MAKKNKTAAPSSDIITEAAAPVLPAASDDAAELRNMRERFEKIATLRNKDFQRYKADLHFLYIDHWDAKTRAQRDGEQRLTLQVDKLLQYQHQIVNDSRMNRPQIKVSPLSGGAMETADIFDGLIRHIQERSNADATFDTALECSTGGGFGFLRLVHEYAHEGTREQEIAFKCVSNPLTVYFGAYREPDGSDVREVYITEDVPKDEFEEEWPDADLQAWESGEQKYGDWIGETIRVAERYWTVKEDRLMNVLPDGSIISDEEYQLAKVQMPPGEQMPPITDAWIAKVNVVKWAKFCGASYLEQPVDTVWSWIPVIPVWGNIQNIDGEVRHVSMIHNSKDAQLLYDYSRSAFAERVGMTPEAPTQAPAGAIENYLEEWDGTKRVRVQRYDHLDDSNNPYPAPQRTQPVDIPSGFAQDMQLSEHDIQGTLGMYQASLGRQGNATSGIQEREQASKGDVATFHYHDNLARALKHAGRIIVYAIPKVYDTKRIIRTLGADGEPDQVQIDPTSPVPYQKPAGGDAVYNLSLGTYDVLVAVGPSYQTRRQEAAAQMAQLASSDPQFMPMYGDLYFKAQDWPFADELAARAKLLLPPQVQQAADKDNAVSPETQAAMAQAQQAIQQRDQQAQQLQQALQAAGQEIAKLKQAEASDQRDLLVKDAEAKLKDRELQVKAYEADTKRMQLEMEQKAQAATQGKADAEQQGAQDQGNALTQATQAIQASAQQMTAAAQALLQAAGQIDAVLRAPKIKQAKATKLPDGSFQLESTERLQ